MTTQTSALARSTLQGTVFEPAGGVDRLTGLGNHARFLARIERQLSLADHDDSGFAVAVLDLRGFRAINDLFGEAAGDTILGQIAARLRTALSHDAYAARLCSDVFALLLPGLTDPEEVHDYCGIVAELLAAPYDLGGRIASVSACIGVSITRDETTDADTVLHQALAALDAAKKAGYGEVMIHTPQIELQRERRAAIEALLPRAIAGEAIDVHFQPIVCMRRNGIGGFEALARWIDPELGFVSPVDFIEIAEQHGMIGQLFRIVIEKSLIAAREWPEELFVSVNLSPSQMVDSNTSRVILDALERFGFAPERLEIEITESAVIANRITAERIISDLKAAGVRLSLDDFGTGQSSLNRLRQIPFDKLKIDRSFVTVLNEDQPTETIIRCVLDMCHGLGIKVIAEGVETREQAAKLFTMGCNGMQGYLFGKPATAAATMELLRRNQRGPAQSAPEARPATAAVAS